MTTVHGQAGGAGTGHIDEVVTQSGCDDDRFTGNRDRLQCVDLHGGGRSVNTDVVANVRSLDRNGISPAKAVDRERSSDSTEVGFEVLPGPHDGSCRCSRWGICQVIVTGSSIDR